MSENKKEKTNPFANATMEVKKAIDKAVREEMELNEINTNDLRENKELWKLMDIGTSITTFYRLIGSPEKLGGDPSRRTYQKVCKRLGIPLDFSKHPLTVRQQEEG